MRFISLIMLIFTVTLLFSRCNDDGIGNYNEGEIIMNELDINGFGTILRSPHATIEHSLNDIAKIMYYDNWDDLDENTAAINIAERTLFRYPIVTSRSIDHREPDYNMSEADVEVVLSILEKYEVLTWDGHYGVEFEEGAMYDFFSSWQLVIQFIDGTIIISGGNTSPSYAPEGYVEFYTELMEFTHSRKPNR